MKIKKLTTFSVNIASQAAVALLEYLVINDCSNEKLKKKDINE